MSSGNIAGRKKEKYSPIAKVRKPRIARIAPASRSCRGDVESVKISMFTTLSSVRRRLSQSECILLPDREAIAMQEDSTARVPSNCASSCGAALSIEELNRTCYCLSVDKEALHRALEQELAERALSDDMITRHANLFAAVPMFVSRAHLEQMSQVIRAVEAVVATIQYQHAATSWAPEIARFNPGSRGGLLGFDFHLSVGGPKLIEINTNPGGVLLNALLSGALGSCCREVTALALTPVNTHAIERAVLAIFLSEWRLQRHGAPLKSVAIVDETPTQQYLYPE